MERFFTCQGKEASCQPPVRNSDLPAATQVSEVKSNPDSQYNLVNNLTTILVRPRAQKHRNKPVKLCEIINTDCFAKVNFEISCYATVTSMCVCVCVFVYTTF